METNQDLGEPYQQILLLSSSLHVDPFYFISGGIILFLLFLSGVISGSEVAYFSLKRKQLTAFKSSDSKTEKLIYSILERPKRLLATILVFNNLVNVGIVTLSTHLSWKVAEATYPEDIELVSATFLFIITVLIVFFGEVIPKVYAKQRSIFFAKQTVRLMKIAGVVLTPFSKPLLMLSSIVERRIDRKGYKVSADDLSKAIDITTSEDEQTTNEEKDILKGIVHFGTVTVTQVMRSRIDITAVDVKMDFHQLMDRINKCGLSRIPVYEETIDRIQGILYIKDLLPYLDRDENFEWQKLLREAYFIPESKKIDDLLKNFQEKRVHMAIIADEYGGTAGLITLEDIIEEIVGEINDEFDEEEIKFQQINEETFIFEGKTSINNFTKVVGVSSDTFDRVKGENESIGGLLLEVHKTMPNSGEEILINDFKFTVEAVNSKRIKRIKVEKLAHEAKEE